MVWARVHWLCYLLFLTAPIWCQQDMGVITGVVTDTSGAVIPGAQVTVVNQATGEKWGTRTGMAGTYTVGPLRVGTYNVEVEQAGFGKSLWVGIELHAQDRVRADFKLQVGQLSETVSVTSQAPLLQNETASVSHVVGQKEIRELPLNGRNFQKLAWLSAGVQPATLSRDSESGFNSHGQPFNQNNFMVDGIDNSSHIMGINDLRLQATVPSLDAVAEFKVETSNYSAEFGRNSGALMIINIKSGSNAFHGSAYEFLRNDVFDARDTFNYVDRNDDGKADPEVLRQNQFGVTLGGPIRRNRIFFFGSWEGRRERHAQSDTAIVPTADERNGLFSSALRVIRDPDTGQPFPGNQVPRARFDSTAARLLELWPLPNFTGSGTRTNYINNPPWTVTRDQIDTRVDANLTDSDRIFVRFSSTRSRQVRQSVFPEPARGSADDSFRNNSQTPVRSVASSFLHVFRPTLLNEFRYGFNRQVSNWRELTDELLGDLTEKYGIYGIPARGWLRGLPGFTFGGAIGYTGLGEASSLPNTKYSQVHQYANNLSWYHGQHNFKFGADIRFNRSDATVGTNAHGSLAFDGSFTNVSFADFLLGKVASGRLGTGLSAQMRFRDFMFYAQDDWKVTPKLTLNLGLRYELNTPWYDKHNNMNALDISPGPGFGQILTAGYCGDSYSCRALVNLDTNNWAPRFGIAWQWNQKTVVRGGAGVFYGGQGAFGANGRGVNNYPYATTVTLQSTPAAAAFPLSAGFPGNLFGDPDNPPANANWSVWEKNSPLPTVYQWNVALQRELRRDLSLTVAYVGSSSNFVLGTYNWNGAPPGPPATEPQRRRIPFWNNINLATPYGHSSYHGLDVQLERRYASGFSFTTSYTWGHSIDNVPENLGAAGGGVQDFSNFDGSRGNSNFDRRHRVVAAAVYELPFRKTSRLFGGWALSGVVSGSTGHYFNPTVANARQRLGATATGNWRPDRTADGKLSDPTADRWFDTSAFVLPRDASGAWHFGNAGRNILTSDGLFNLDTALSKSVRVTEQVELQIRAEAFNLTNTPTLGDPDTGIESPDFGKVRSTVNLPRQFQFALRVSF